MLLQTYIYSSILTITASNFQEMLLRDSTLQRQHLLDFDEHNHKVPFVISWPNYNMSRDMGFPNNVVCATSKVSDQPAHTCSLTRAFASRLNIL